MHYTGMCNSTSACVEFAACQAQQTPNALDIVRLLSSAVFVLDAAPHLGLLSRFEYANIGY